MLTLPAAERERAALRAEPAELEQPPVAWHPWPDLPRDSWGPRGQLGACIPIPPWYGVTVVSPLCHGGCSCWRWHSPSHPSIHLCFLPPTERMEHGCCCSQAGWGSQQCHGAGGRILVGVGCAQGNGTGAGHRYPPGIWWDWGGSPTGELWEGFQGDFCEAPCCALRVGKGFRELGCGGNM